MTFISPSSTNCQTWVREHRERLHQNLSALLEQHQSPAPSLRAAMTYATLNGGKRLRALLAYASGYIFEAPLENLDLAAMALELIHSYSLVHDDLPAMDNADLRRGQPTCFKVYGEAYGILAGDALQTLAFEVLAGYPAPLPAAERLQMIQKLSWASGLEGMAAGQALDLNNTAKRAYTEAELLSLYELKTGALLEASLSLGLIAASVLDLKNQSALACYGQKISLAFQIQDDLLDIEGSTERTGKPCGLDGTLDKRTYPELVGVAAAKNKISTLFEEASSLLDPWGKRAIFLRHLTEIMQKREH